MDVPREVLARIQKLVALEGSPNEHEAAAATAAVQRYLTTYRLTRADLAASEIHMDFLLGEGEVSWWFSVLHVVATALGCRAFHANSHQIHAAALVGTDVDLVATKTTYASVFATLRRIVDREWDVYKTSLTDPELGVHPILSDPQTEPRWRQSYALGALDAVQKQLAQNETIALHGLSWTMLDAMNALQKVGVSKDTQLARVDAWVMERFGKPMIVEGEAEILGGAHRAGKKVVL